MRRRAQKLAKTRHRHPRRIILKPFVRLTKSHLFPRGIDAYAELKTHDPRNTENAQNRQGKKARKSLKKILYREQQTRREAEWRAKAEGLEIARQFREAVREDIRKERAALVFEPRRPIWGKYPATMQQPRP